MKKFINSGQFKKGFIPYNKGKKGLMHNPLKGNKMPEEWRKKLCKPKSKKGYNKGEKNGMFKHGLTRLQQQEIKAGRKKSEQCELCGSIGNINYDHDHKTDKFRGWICHRCNWVLGLVKDNKELLELMIKYLN